MHHHVPAWVGFSLHLTTYDYGCKKGMHLNNRETDSLVWSVYLLWQLCKSRYIIRWQTAITLNEGRHHDDGVSFDSIAVNLGTLRICWLNGYKTIDLCTWVQPWVVKTHSNKNNTDGILIWLATRQSVVNWTKKKRRLRAYAELKRERVPKKRRKTDDREEKGIPQWPKTWRHP